MDLTTRARQVVASWIAPAPVTPAVEMKPLDFEDKAEVTRDNPDSNRFGAHVYGTFGDIRVNPDTATQVAAIWACMDVIAGALSSSNWNIYSGYRDTANKTAIPMDRKQTILNTRFNPEMTAQAGKRALMLNAVGFGNGYAEIEWDLAGRPVALWPIPTSRAEPRRDEVTGRLFVRFTQEYGAGTVDVDLDNLVHIRGPSLFGFAGDNMMSRAIRTVAVALALEQHAESYFSNNAQMGTVFVYKGGQMDDTNYRRADESLTQKHRGARKAYTAGLFTGDWDIKTFGKDMADSTYAEIKSLTVDDICRWFHVPPHKVAHLAKSTNNNIEHQGLEFSRDTLRPWVHEVQQELDWKLISARGEPQFVEIDVDWTEQGDYKSRLEAYAIGRNMGVFSANDVLRKLGENTIGADGDIRIVQGANVRLEDVGAAYDVGAGKSEPVEEDKTLTAWLGSIYARVQRRQEQSKPRLGPVAARAGAEKFAIEVLADLPRSVDADAIARGLTEVLDGGDPAKTARSVLEKKP